MTAKTKESFCKDKHFLRYMQIFERIFESHIGVLFSSEETTRRLSVDTDTDLEFDSTLSSVIDSTLGLRCRSFHFMARLYGTRKKDVERLSCGFEV